MREHPHLELERELQRLTEELGFEREGLTHNHRERRRLGEELERERLARLGDQRNVHRLERDLQELQQLLEVLQQALKAPKKGLWTNLLERCAKQLMECGCYGHEYLGWFGHCGCAPSVS
jgi:hypothetical protein